MKISIPINKKTILAFVSAGAVLFFVAAFLLFSGPRMRNQPSLRTFESRVPLPPAGAVPYSGKPDKDMDSLSFLQTVIPEATPENYLRGEVYYGYYCIFCHGKNGKGNGPVGVSYLPKPTDLTQLSAKGTDYQQLFYLSSRGTGHSPVLEYVIPPEHWQYLLLYIQRSW